VPPRRLAAGLLRGHRHGTAARRDRRGLPRHGGARTGLPRGDRRVRRHRSRRRDAARSAKMAAAADRQEGMLDTDATDDQRALLEVSSRFMEDACPLRAVRDGAWREPAFAADYRRQAAELGWFSMLVPEDRGGGSVSGAGAADAALIAYRRGALLQPGSFVGTNVVAFAVAEAGSEALRITVLPALLSGEAPASWAVDAPGPALDAGVTARVLDDGGLELKGSKGAVQDVEAGSWLLVTAATPDGATQALIAADAPGVTLTELDSLDLTRRFAEVRFDGARVAVSAVVGAPGAADELITRQL